MRQVWQEFRVKKFYKKHLSWHCNLNFILIRRKYSRYLIIEISSNHIYDLKKITFKKYFLFYYLLMIKIVIFKQYERHPFWITLSKFYWYWMKKQYFHQAWLWLIYIYILLVSFLAIFIEYTIVSWFSNLTTIISFEDG